ncbi:MAG: hypothetical protein JWM31_2335 [Solirubrobacterales bacterium]|nr:hypothetical protein [Solirubrobacterales bacterium]
MSAPPSAPADQPGCDHAGCTREADYRVQIDGRPALLRCRWHADAAWRPHAGTVTVAPLHGEVPLIDTHAGRRATLLPALLIALCLVLVVVGFAVIAPVMLRS